MASLGPQLPPHLQKRKRDSEDEETPDSPPSKQTRRTNQDEIDLGEDSDDDFGPTAGPKAAARTSAPPKPSLGPSLPSAANQDEVDLDDSEEDSDTGPPPPPLSTGPSIAFASGPVIGPTLPPGPLNQMPKSDPNDAEEDSDSDDDFGPALPSAAAGRNGHPSSAGASGPAMPPASAPEPIVKRDDWMLAPPTESGPRAPDPTKLKARGFTSGRAAGSRGAGEISSIWTETPEEKARRLKDAVLGRSDAAGAPAAAGRPSAATASKNKAAADGERIRSYTEQTRGKSLYEQHQDRQKSTVEAAKKSAEEEDDPSKRAFDKEKDMAIGGRLSNSQRREMLTKAADFGGRFQKGNYL